MHVVSYQLRGAGPAAGVRDEDGVIRPLALGGIGALLALPLEQMREVVDAAATAEPVAGARLRAPIDGRIEVWAAGVTYRRSREARMEESAVADVYWRVYDAERPELFLKSVAWRVVGDGEPIGVRADSAIDVPEPELALVLNAHRELVGFTVCNDVSSRSIEGDNPLYLPQAKVYAGACALGPGIRPVWEVRDPADLGIEVEVTRGGIAMWSARTSTAEIHRSFADLTEHLFRADVFPEGVVLSTGTGVVPDIGFTLLPDDVVRITIDEVGTLTNRVVSGPDAFGWLADPAGVPAVRA